MTAEAISLTPRHVCRLIIPLTTSSASTVGLTDSTSTKLRKIKSQPPIVPLYPSVCKSSSNQLLSSSFLFETNFSDNKSNELYNSANVASSRVDSSSPPPPLSQRDTNECNEQQFGSFSGMPSSSIHSAGGGGGGMNTIEHTATSSALRHVNSGSTVASSTSNRSLVSMTHQHTRSASFQQQQKQQYGNSTVTTAASTITAPSSNTGNKSTRPLGQLAQPVNPQTSSPMKVVFNKYLLVPTIDGKVFVYEIYDFDKIEHQLFEREQSLYREKQRQRRKALQNKSSASKSSAVPSDKYNSDFDPFHVKIDAIRRDRCKVQNEKEKVEPIYSIGPFHIREYYDNHVKIMNEGEVNDTTSSTSNNIISSIVALSHLTTEPKETIPTSEPEHYVSILTNEGDIHILRFNSGYSSTTSLRQSTGSLQSQKRVVRDGQQQKQRLDVYHQIPDNHHGLQIEYITSFFSGHLGATCLSMFEGPNQDESLVKNDEDKNCVSNELEPSNANSNLKGAPSTDKARMFKIIVGHDNGMITGFDVLRIRSNHLVDKVETILSWNGKFYDNCSIQSLTFLRHHPRNSSFTSSLDSDDDQARNEDEALDSEKAAPLENYIAIGMGQSPLNAPDPFISANASISQPTDPSILTKSQCLEVVNITTFEKEWGLKFGNVVTKKNNVSADYVYCTKKSFDPLTHWLPFENFTVWPIREVLESNNEDGVLIDAPSYRKKSSKKQRNIKKSSESEMFGVTRIENSYDRHDQVFVAATSDGIVASMHYYINRIKSESLQDLRWGLSCRKNKVKLPHKAFAMELFKSKSKQSGSSSDHIVSCLKDGTVFIIPINSMDNKDDDNFDDMIVISIEPQREQSSKCIRLTQGFTAGNVQMRNWGHNVNVRGEDQCSNINGIPLLFHAWPGGTIDCHVGGLSPEFIRSK